MNVSHINAIRIRVLGKRALSNLGIALFTTLPLTTQFTRPAHATEPDRHPNAIATDRTKPTALSTLIAPSEPVIPRAIQQIRPRTGAQLLQQRWAALEAGQMYSQLPPHSFETQWRREREHPGYGEWLDLLTHEAQAMVHGQGDRALTVMVGDSLTQRIPTELLPQDRLWLNQSISGETATLITRRLHLFAQTRPDAIHVMAGINDLKNGATDDQVISSIQALMRQLRQQHPTATVTIHSILPTRWPNLSGDRIRSINDRLMTIAQQEAVQFLDLQQHFTDDQGQLDLALTTDGLHLSDRGYVVWQSVMHQL